MVLYIIMKSVITIPQGAHSPKVIRKLKIKSVTFYYSF